MVSVIGLGGVGKKISILSSSKCTRFDDLNGNKFADNRGKFLLAFCCCYTYLYLGPQADEFSYNSRGLILFFMSLADSFITRGISALVGYFFAMGVTEQAIVEGAEILLDQIGNKINELHLLIFTCGAGYTIFFELMIGFPIFGITTSIAGAVVVMGFKKKRRWWSVFSLLISLSQKSLECYFAHKDAHRRVEEDEISHTVRETVDRLHQVLDLLSKQDPTPARSDTIENMAYNFEVLSGKLQLLQSSLQPDHYPILIQNELYADGNGGVEGEESTEG